MPMENVVKRLQAQGRPGFPRRYSGGLDCASQVRLGQRRATLHPQGSAAAAAVQHRRKQPALSHRRCPAALRKALLGDKQHRYLPPRPTCRCCGRRACAPSGGAPCLPWPGWSLPWLPPGCCTRQLWTHGALAACGGIGQTLTDRLAGGRTSRQRAPQPCRISAAAAVVQEQQHARALLCPLPAPCSLPPAPCSLLTAASGIRPALHICILATTQLSWQPDRLPGAPSALPPWVPKACMACRSQGTCAGPHAAEPLVAASTQQGCCTWPMQPCAIPAFSCRLPAVPCTFGC